jgi:tetratricopeptide (TPR) repeat protein
MREDKYHIPYESLEDYEKAKKLRLEGNYDSARLITERLLEKHPEHPKLWNTLGSISFSEGDYKKAEGFFLKAIAYGPGIALIYSNLSRTYGVLGDLDRSAKYARRAIRADPTLSTAWNTLGLYYIDKGQIEIAVDYFVAACLCGEEDLESAFNAACALCELGETDDALHYLEISLREEFFYNYALKDETLEPLRGLAEYELLIAEAAERFNKVKNR